MVPAGSCAIAAVLTLSAWALALLLLSIATLVVFGNDARATLFPIRTVAIPVTIAPAAITWWWLSREVRRWLDAKTTVTPVSRLGI